MADRRSLTPWPDPPPSPKVSPGTRAWTILRRLRDGGWLRPRRLGCLFVILMLLLFTALCSISGGENPGFGPNAIRGNPLKPVQPGPNRKGSDSPVLDTIRNRGWLIVAVDETPGLIIESQRGSRNYTGFARELVDSIAHDLGVNPDGTNFKPTLPSQREGSLRRREVQLVLAGGSTDAQQGAENDVSGPYLVYRPQLAVPVDSPVHSLDSLGDGKVCTHQNSPVATELKDELGDRLTTRASLSDCAELLGGEVKALAGDETALRRLPATPSGGELRMIGAPHGVITYGIEVPPGDPVFRDRINQILRRVIADGTWENLYVKYFGAPAPQPPIIR